MMARARRVPQLAEALVSHVANEPFPLAPLAQFEAPSIAHPQLCNLFACGIWAAPVVYPAVSLGQSILRVIPTAMHTEADIDYLVRSVGMIRGALVLGSLSAD